MQFNPKIGFILGILVTIEIAISSGTVSLTNVVPAAYVPYVVGWCGLLAFAGSTILTFLHGYSNGQVGPLVPDAPLDKTVKATDKAIADLGSLKSQAIAAGQSPPMTTGLAIALAVATALGLGWPGTAHAQTRLPSAAPHANAVGQPCDPLNLIPGCKEQATSKGIDDLVSKLDMLSLPDFEFALAQAKAANNEVTQPCWSAWVDLIKARQAAALGPDGQPLPLPDPHIITAIERISELLAILRPDSKISLACVQIANVAGKDAATVLTGILSGGALGLFKLPIVPIP